MAQPFVPHVTNDAEPNVIKNSFDDETPFVPGILNCSSDNTNVELAVLLNQVCVDL